MRQFKGKYPKFTGQQQACSRSLTGRGVRICARLAPNASPNALTFALRKTEMTLTTTHRMDTAAQQAQPQDMAAGPAHPPRAPATLMHVPDTLSAEARQVMHSLVQVNWDTRRAPAPDDHAAWQRLRHAQIAAQTGPGLQQASREGVALQDLTLGGVPVLEIRPSKMHHPERVIVYVHGGAYTMSSARGRLLAMPVLANDTGLRIISVDYTTAPDADWQVMQEQLMSVIRALMRQGHDLARVALLGDSAGGGLVTSTVLNLRDQGLGQPGAVVLWSPWVDLSNAGDTACTLLQADPILSYELFLKNSALAFANGLDLTDPRISPLHADFQPGFAPTLIQEGTRTIFLSTSVRLYRKLDEAHLNPVIDMYEGMPHVFQDLPVPEARWAIRKSAAFIQQHLC